MKTRIEDYCVWLPFNGFPLDFQQSQKRIPSPHDRPQRLNVRRTELQEHAITMEQMAPSKRREEQSNGGLAYGANPFLPLRACSHHLSWVIAPCTIPNNQLDLPVDAISGNHSVYRSRRPFLLLQSSRRFFEHCQPERFFLGLLVTYSCKPRGCMLQRVVIYNPTLV